MHDDFDNSLVHAQFCVRVVVHFLTVSTTGSDGVFVVKSPADDPQKIDSWTSGANTHNVRGDIFGKSACPSGASATLQAYMIRPTVIVNSEGRLVRGDESRVMRSSAAPAASSKIVLVVGQMNFRVRDIQHDIPSPASDVRPAR